MKKFLLIVIFLPFLISFLFPDESVSTTDDALSTLENPAGLGFHRTFEGCFKSNFDPSGSVNVVGFYMRKGAIGFGAISNKLQNSYNSYILASGLPIGKNLYIGSAYRWFSKIKRTSEWNIGLLFRPKNILSLGITGIGINSPDGFSPQYNLGIGIRPFGGNRFTISLDGQLINREGLHITDSLNLTLQSAYEPIDGIVFKGHYSKESFGLGIALNLAHFRTEGYSSFGENNKFESSEVLTSFSVDRYRTILKAKKKFWVKLVLAGSIEEEDRPTLFFRKPKTILRDILSIIDKLGNDDDVTGIYLVLNSPKCGFAKLQEIRKSLEEFKKQNKKIYCYADIMGNKDYYLATVADSIFMNPSGELNLTGLVSEIPFFKGTLNKIGIDAELEHIGKYKSASDIFTQDSMTPAHKEVTNAILDDLYKQFTEAIAQSRKITNSQIKQLIDSGPYTAKEAVKNNLIDKLVYKDEMMERFKKIKTLAVPIAVYKNRKEYVYDWRPVPDKSIAIIYATGNIVVGKSTKNFLSGNLMGSETIVNAIRAARQDKNVKAIILRIDSGGGSGLASDMIWREVKRTTEGARRKPFIVSMSDVAGSGGYYIACAADIILADEGTITGSIGVLGGKFSYERLLKKIGMRFETTKRGKNADMYLQTKSFTKEQREKLKKDILEFYQDFIKKVAEGRGLSTAKVDSIGKGRIWTGDQAKSIRLIDEIGGLKEAIMVAKQKAGIKENEKVGIEIYPKYKVFGLLSLFNRSTAELSPNLPDEIGKFIFDVGKYWVYEDENILYIMPYTINIK